MIKKILKNKKGANIIMLLSGVLLGITYGAGILLKEKNNISKESLTFIGSFLLLAHSLIEDPLLFVIFGADIKTLIIIRIVLALVASLLIVFIVKKFNISLIK